MILVSKGLHIVTQTLSRMLFVLHGSRIRILCPSTLGCLTVPSGHHLGHLEHLFSPLCCPYCFSVQLNPYKSCPDVLKLGGILEYLEGFEKYYARGSTARGSNLMGWGLGPGISIMLELFR